MTRARCLQLLRERHAAWAIREVQSRGVYLNQVKWLYYGVPITLAACNVAMLALGWLKSASHLISIGIVGAVMVLVCGVLARCTAAVAVLVEKKPDRDADTAAITKSQYESLIAIAHEIPATGQVFFALLCASDELEKVGHPSVTPEAKKALTAVREIVYDDHIEERN